MFKLLLCKQQNIATGFGLFAGGNTGSATAVTEKYDFSTNSVTNGTNLTTASWSHGVNSISAYALFGGGYTGSTVISTVQKYTYSGDSLSSGTNLLLARSSLAAGNNATHGIFGGGDTGFAVNSAVTDKYTLSNNSVTAGTNLGTARRNISACASSAIVYFGAGYGASSWTGVVDKYTISTNGVVSGTSLTARWGPAATSTTTAGYFFAGEPQYMLNQEYAFSSNTVTSKTSLSGGRLVPGCAGNSAVAIISAGLNSSFVKIKTSEKYTFASNAMTTGTDLSVTKESVSGASSTPGHL